MRILFVSANPHWTERLDLAQELRTLQRCLKGFDVELILRPAAQIEDLNEVLNDPHDDRPIDIVHFCGHADGKDGLFFRDAEGLEEALPPSELKELLEKSGKGIKLAVLNACSTRETALELMKPRKLADDAKTEAEASEIVVTRDTANDQTSQAVSSKPVVGGIIFTESKLDDNVGILMTKVLYTALGKNKSLNAAFEDAKKVITAPSETKKQKSRFVYMLNPDGANPDLSFEKKGGPEKEPEIDEEEEQRFHRYFYLNYLDEQIETLQQSVITNRRILIGLFVLVVGLFYLSPFTWESLVGFPDWLLKRLRSEAVSEEGARPLLTSLQALGNAIPAYYAALQTRWCVHGSIKLRQLKSLKELVKKSEDMDATLQARLDKILDESLRTADADWKPLTTFIGELIGAGTRPVNENSS